MNRISHLFASARRLMAAGAALLMLHAGASAQIPVIPTPAKASAARGALAVGSATAVNARGGAYADALADSVRAFVSPFGAGEGSVTLLLADSLRLPDEAYTLEVSPDGATLAASSRAGLYYAFEAFRQLARAGNGKVQACRVNDAPRFAWRGFMLDESRHFFGKEKVKQYLDIMASLRLNVLHWHLADEPGWRIEIKRYPRLTTVGGRGNWHDPEAPAQFYTQDDIREIVAYAADRHIMVVPEFDMPGHASAATRAYPELSGGGEGQWAGFTFHPVRDSTFTFIADVIDELVGLFPAPYIHIGGDEVHYGNSSWYTSPEIQQYIADKKLDGPVGLEREFMRRAADIVAAHGKTVIGWDEIIDAGISPSKAVIMWWRHDKAHRLLMALESGYRVIMTPRRPLYADFVQDGSHSVGRFWNGYNRIEDVAAFPEPVMHLAKGYEDRILGLQMSLWTERVADAARLDFMTFPRLAGVAEAAWTPAVSKEPTLFMRKLPRFLRWLDTKNINYYNPFDPKSTPEPSAPDKADVLKNG